MTVLFSIGFTSYFIGMLGLQLLRCSILIRTPILHSNLCSEGWL